MLDILALLDMMDKMTVAKESPTKLLVVGAGVIGLSVAWHCRGFFDEITLIDSDPNQATSLVAGGMLAPVTEAHFGEETLIAFNLNAAKLYPSFVQEVEASSNCCVGLQTTGTLCLGKTSSDLAQLTQLAKFQEKLGLNIKPLSASTAKEMEPLLSSRLAGGYLAMEDFVVEPIELCNALNIALSNNRVASIREEIVEISLEKPNLISAITRSNEVITGTHLCLASGSQIGRINFSFRSNGPLSGGNVANRQSTRENFHLPIRPVRGQIIRLRPQHFDSNSANGLFMHHTVRAYVDAKHVYVLSRRNGEVVIGATSEEQGYHKANTVEGIYELLRCAQDIIPSIRELEIVRLESGLRPATSDNFPIIGPLYSSNICIATGHYRNGILQAPITGSLVAEYFSTGKIPLEIKPFSPERFQENIL